MAGLTVVPAVVRDAGPLADRRTRAVGGDQQPRGDASSPSDSCDLDAIRIVASKSGHRIGAQHRRRRAFAFSTSASTSGGFSIMWANGSPGSTSPAKVRKAGRTASCELGVGHHHVEDRLRSVRDRIPDAECLEQPPRGGGDRRGARVAWRPHAAQRRVGHHDREGIAEPLAQRDRERQTGKSGAADQHIGRVRQVPFCIARILRQSRHRSWPLRGVYATAIKARSCPPPSRICSPFSISSRSK